MKQKRDRFGFQSPVAAARASHVVHWRCDHCPLVVVVDRADGRPPNWVTIKGMSTASSVSTLLCPACSLKLAATLHVRNDCPTGRHAPLPAVAHPRSWRIERLS